jgi:hypothetical protein
MIIVDPSKDHPFEGKLLNCQKDDTSKVSSSSGIEIATHLLLNQKRLKAEERA